MIRNIYIIFLICFLTLSCLSVRSSMANPTNLSQKYTGDLTYEEYNQFFNDTFFFSAVERALIQKAIDGKVDEVRQTLRLEETKQAEVLDPATFKIEYRPRSPTETAAPAPRVIPQQQPKQPPQQTQQQPKAQQPQTQPLRRDPPPAPVDNRNFRVNTVQQVAPAPVIPEQRLIVVSGVIFRKADDWIVWINGKKVTPGNYLPEIIEIRVENSSHVHLKWYDIGLQDVISITLRPNQIYDITTGVLLPG